MATKTKATEVRCTLAEAVRLVGQIGGDGHGICNAAGLAEAAGVRLAVVQHLEREHQNDGSHKGSIFVGGQVVKSLRGVYTLSVLRWLAGQVGADTRVADQCLGRGTEARALSAAILGRARALAEGAEGGEVDEAEQAGVLEALAGLQQLHGQG